MTEYDADANFKVIKGIVICKNTGEYLVDKIIDSEIDPLLLAGFVSALSSFAKANMGKIEEISVKGLDMEMIIVSAFNLILIVLMDRDFYKDIVREQGENILRIFYQIYQHQLDDVCDTSKYDPFQEIIFSEIMVCLARMKTLEQKRNALRAGIEYSDK